MRHKICRAAVVDRRVGAAASAHLERCAECAAFARALEEVFAAARALVPTGVPAGLEERVLSRMTAAASAPVGLPADDGVGAVPGAESSGVSVSWGRRLGTGVAALGARVGTRERPRLATRPVRRSLALAGLAAALVVAVVVAGVVPVGHGGDRTAALHGLLLTDAQRTAAAGSAELQFTATSDVTFSFPPPSIPKAPSVTVPTLPSLPQVSVPPCPGADSIACQAAGQSAQEFQSQIQQFEQCMSQYEAAASQITMPTVPSAVSYTFGVDGSGEVAQPDQLELAGTVRLLQSRPATTDGPHAYQLIVTGGHAYEQVDGGTWQSVPAPAGVLGPLVLDPGTILSLMKGAQGPVVDLGTSEMDGVEVHHLRFDTPGSALAGAPSGTGLIIDVWAGVQDHLVRQFDVQASVSSPTGVTGARFNAHSSMSLHLSDFGVPVSLTVPSPVSGTLQPQGGPGVFLYPFPNGLSFSLSAPQAPVLQTPAPQPTAPQCSVTGTPAGTGVLSPPPGPIPGFPGFPSGPSAAPSSPGSSPDFPSWNNGGAQPYSSGGAA